MGRRWSLTGQLLASQLVTVLLVLVAVAAVSLAQSRARFDETAGGRALAVAETVANTPSLRSTLELRRTNAVGNAASEEGGPTLVQVRTVAESARSVSGSESVLVADAGGTVVASALSDELGAAVELPGDVLRLGRSWVGSLSSENRSRTVAQVPVLSDDLGQVGTVVGLVAVSRERPTALESLSDSVPNLLVYLSVASALGVAGSLLVARRVKRQTLGLEPLEITGLVEHRDATLHGIKEGMIALDTNGTVTLANDMATQLLDLPTDAVGRHVHGLGLKGAVQQVLTQDIAGTDVPVATRDRLLVVNRMPILSRGRRIGSVTTLRDRTEMMALQRELDVVHDVTRTLRAQAHEFSNRLHTISGLIELGEYDEVVGYVARISRSDEALADTVTSRIADPAVAALLIAKASLATEQGVDLRLDPESYVTGMPHSLSADVATVIGNLVDNAVDAAGTGVRDGVGWVRVRVVQDDDGVMVTVTDSGPGIAASIADALFERGTTTKPEMTGGRGIGLSLVRMVCNKRGGSVAAGRDDGTVFTARLPVRATEAV